MLGPAAPPVFIPTVQFATALPLNGWLALVDQGVVAQSGPAYSFTAQAGVIPGGCCSVVLIANGLSNGPSFPSGWTGSGSWVNAVGTPNLVTVSFDGYVFSYSIGQGFSSLRPTPTTFTATHGTTAITITIGGQTLAAVTPPASAFTVTATRPATGGQPLPITPYTLSSVSAVLSGATSVTLNVSAPIALGDIIALSHTPAFADPTQGQTPAPLQDSSNEYVPQWSGAVVSIS